MNQNRSIAREMFHVLYCPAHSILIEHHYIVDLRGKFVGDRPPVLFGPEPRSNHGESAEERQQSGARSPRHDLPLNQWVEPSGVAPWLVGIFQAKKNNMGTLTRHRPGQLSRINAVTRIEWNRDRSTEP
jgi:hypothetical protein